MRTSSRFALIATLAACVATVLAGRDYYDILDVPRDATVNIIKKSYRRLARLYHPDKHPGDNKMEQKFKDISQAYEVLANEKKRQTYDNFGEEGLQNGGGGGGGGGAGFHGFNGGNFHMRFDDSMFDDMFGGGGFGGFGGGGFGGGGGGGGFGFDGGRRRHRHHQRKKVCFQSKVCENGSCFMVKECKN